MTERRAADERQLSICPVESVEIDKYLKTIIRNDKAVKMIREDRQANEKKQVQR